MGNKTETFSALAPFEAKEYSLFGKDEQPVPLDSLMKAEGPLLEQTYALRGENQDRYILEICRATVSIVGISGLFVLMATIVAIILFAYGQIEGGVVALVGTILASLAGRVSATKDMCDDIDWSYFLWSRKARNYVHSSKAVRAKNRAKIDALQSELDVWNKLPEAVKDDARQLVALIHDHDANIRMFNAEAKRAKFYVERGHLEHEKAEAGLLAMRETLQEQRREIVETIMSADAACIALVCQPEGERSLITPNLEALRAKLNGLGESVREHLALETIIRRELDDPEADFNQRLLAKNTQAETK